jgi:hypothetical protein
LILGRGLGAALGRSVTHWQFPELREIAEGSAFRVKLFSKMCSSATPKTA